MKHLRYMGEFLSKAGIIWRAEIFVEAEEPFAAVGSLTFEADEPITIEWGETPKSQAVCSSSATLRIESPGDRTYTDLYTIEPGRVRLDIYRAGLLYWSGTLDPEFYEEPYERADKYPVSLTFSDFGILDRLKYELTGVQSLYAILTNALERSAVKYNGIDYETYCSTQFDDADSTPATINRIALRSDNFIDEEGEQSTMRDVIEGMLLPLGLRLIQRCGNIYVYDLNGLWQQSTAREIYWTSDSQTLSVDSVYNNVKITFSPYAEETLISSEIEYTGEYSADKYNTTNFLNYEDYGVNYFSFATDYSQENKPTGRYGDWENVHFTIFLSKDDGRGLAYLNPSARYAHILPMVNGPEETDCIAWKVVVGHDSIKYHPENCHNLLNEVSPTAHQVLMKSQRAYLPALGIADREQYYLRLTLPILLDMRYNPFTDANGDNESGHQDKLKVYGSWVFVPVAVNLYNSEGVITHHYENRERTLLGTQGDFAHSLRGGEWVEGTTKLPKCWLAYYNPSNDIKDNTAMGEWAENRQNIGRPDVDGRITLHKNFFSDYNKKFRIYESFKAMPAGEFIPYPPQGGMIEIVVYTGVRGFRWGEPQTADNNFDAGWDDPTPPDPSEWIPSAPDWANRWVQDGIYKNIRWLLYKAPNLDIVKNNLIFDSAELDDVEYSGELNKDAKEELSMDTICGTLENVSPTARGVFFRLPGGKQICTLTRAGVTDQAENLFIGTMYSQYSERMTSLSGENSIDPAGLNAYSDANQPAGVKFLMTADTQNPIEDCTESTFIELRPDNFKSRKE